MLIKEIYGRLLITNAAITPGIQPNSVRIVVIMIDPQPLSRTASGGKMIHRITRKQLIEMNSFIR